MNCINKSNLLLNVEWILVPCKSVDAYVCFQHKLSDYLVCKYPKYYAGTQVYLDKVSQNSITIVGTYYDVCGLKDVYYELQADIDDFYNKYWNCTVGKSSLLSFMDNKRVLPPSVNTCNCSW